jgi:hypothetical protein
VVARRLLAWLAALLALALLAAALAPQAEPVTRPSAPRPGTPGTVASRTLVRVLPRGGRVAARVGDFVTLDVPVRAPDTVEIAGLGLSAFAAPGAPAQIEFLADPAGTYAVTLLSSGARLGTLRIQPPAAASPPRASAAAA